jgi:hypothetical protein
MQGDALKRTLGGHSLKYVAPGSMDGASPGSVCLAADLLRPTTGQTINRTITGVSAHKNSAGLGRVAGLYGILHRAG